MSQVDLDDLERYTRNLAQTHVIGKQTASVELSLIRATEQSEKLLQQARQHFEQIARDRLIISDAGEWLLDNFHTVQQALNQVVEDLPRRYYRELPKLDGTPLAGYPRVYALARDIITTSDGSLNLDYIQTFVTLYQDHAPLTMGELWALPAMLRIISLENLTWAICQLTGIADMPVLSADPAISDQVADESLVATSILNLRTLATQDWERYFETVSRVDQILRQVPARVYADMDFETRNRYRHEIEKLAPESGQAQESVARAVVSLAQRADTQQLQTRSRHVGYYLIDEGRRQLETEIGFRPSLRLRINRGFHRRTLSLYLGSILLATTLILLMIGVYIDHAGVSLTRLIVVLGLSLLPASVIAIQLVNWMVSRIVPPRILPKMDFSDGIPSDSRTLVVIPALLSDTEEIDSLAQQLELHYLRNNDPNLFFALLADYPDAPEQHMPDDEVLLNRAHLQIRGLNERHGAQDTPRFHLFLRERRWNPSEDTWMGWERKRGKLVELNRLLLNPHSETTYFIKGGNLQPLPHIRYVITVDADTILPKGSAQRLAATLSHPLNQPAFDPTTQTVVEGYAILQPRVEITPTAANRSWFTRIFAGDTSLDLYTRAVSNVYQDCFGEGTYVGKGIYDVAAFHRSLSDRIPENRLLSHDLFEGLYARAALVTDIVLLEDYPPHYLAHMNRLHRWVRGDWQLLPWLLPQVPTEEGQSIRNPLSWLDRWKIADNLRRSIVEPALLFLLVTGWVVLPGSPLFWTLFVLLASGFPFITSMVNQLLQVRRPANWSFVSQSLLLEVQRWWLYLLFLPHQAFVNIDAILTTLLRLLRRRRMLQWITAAHVVRLFGGGLSLGVILQQMHTSMFLAVLVALLILITRPLSILLAAPFLLAWGSAPAIARYLSQPISRPSVTLSSEELRKLRVLARRTWLFFEKFVAPDDHWLPPDHFQETPREILAHQTSPTNIGLYLLSILAAHDLGYIGLSELSTRLEFTFESLGKLERYRGHFLNWYDTRSLNPLPPRYVSTVDSGNLIGSLITLNQGLEDLLSTPVVQSQRWQGLLDALAVLNDTLTATQVDESDATAETVTSYLTRIEQQIRAVQNDPMVQAVFLSRITTDIWPNFSDVLIEFVNTQHDALSVADIQEIRICTRRVHRHLENMQRDISMLLPWLPMLAQPPALFYDPQLDPAILEEWHKLVETLHIVPQLGAIVPIYQEAQSRLDQLRQLLAKNSKQNNICTQAEEWCLHLSEAVASAQDAVNDLLDDFMERRCQLSTYIQDADFSFLFNESRKLFHIGYNVSSEKLDDSYYDLLASEARIASLIMVAMDQVPQEHWLHMGRPLTRLGGMQALLSWGGTMFEYLMPRLLMRSYPETLLDQSYQAAVAYQVAYGRENRIPWGVSEAGYYAFDANMNYQYRAFGVPDLALRRNIAPDLVVTPHASLLALPIRPQAVLDNIEAFEQIGAYGTYGLYEAVDYTRSRLAHGQEYALVYEYMAHHQGMILLALTNYLDDDIMVERFHSAPSIQSVELLLQEQIPQHTTIQPPVREGTGPQHSEQAKVTAISWQVPVIASVPQVHCLSNGRYGLLITSTGAGYSQWKDIALTRWRADMTLEDWGTWLYLRDQDSGEMWSVGYQPSASGDCNVTFHPHKAEFRCRNYEITAQMEIVVSPDEDLEIRLIRLTNHSADVRRLMLTSYGEIVLAPQEDDQRHPAFNKLFIESEFVSETGALLFHRRPRSANEATFYMAHLLVLEENQDSDPVFETDRGSFLGRNRTVAHPSALTQAETGFARTTGAVLDPIMALGREIELEPYATVQMAYITLAATTRTKAVSLARFYRSWTRITRTFGQAQRQNEAELRQIGVDMAELGHIQKLLSALLYPQPGFRAENALLASNTESQAGLWAYGISGDYPILLARIGDESELSLVRELIQAHAYWRKRQIKVTLVILNEQGTHYARPLHNQIHRLIVRMGSETWINHRAGIFILSNDQLNETKRALLVASARVFLDGARGPLVDQLQAADAKSVYLPDFVPSRADNQDETTPPLIRPDNLWFDNGFGGFDSDKREYVIYYRPGQETPAPWINVIANSEAGFFVSEAGGGFSWAVNSSENRLTAWQNDPVTDMPSEAVYLRDEETAEIWTPTPMPAGADRPYLIRHGTGYSIFELHSHGLKQHLQLFVAPDAPVKIVRLRLENTWKRVRRITVTYYAEWVLGTRRDVTQQYIIPEFDPNTQILLARNPYSIDFGECFTFVSANKDFHGLTTDRTEFLGRLGRYAEPAALRRIGLSGTVDPGTDTCAAVQLHVDLQPEATEEIFFVIGGGVNRQEALKLAQRYRQPAEVGNAWKRMLADWDAILTSIQVQTPEPSMNLILPWLLYQAISCRLWGRSALYQSGGAFGFRDQLQDVMAVLHARPEIAREHILRAAEHQFEAGDVLHWWHPPTGRGVRTRFSDDLIWLPYVTAHYISTTGDEAILDERIPFKKGKPLQPSEEERYDYYESTDGTYTLYEHCVRALNRGLTAGAHGLPLMGSGDWNDGMNRVGIEGDGESVWVGWFLYATINAFINLCSRRGDEKLAASYRQRINELQAALEDNAWDGKWYLRAFYDDGSPLGSSQNEECRIDSIAQSWGVLSRAASPERARQAMQSVQEWLVKPEDQLLLLFTPPFDKTEQDPGYIKGYPPGIRENGGQYTHAALWVAWAMAEMGNGDRAEALFQLLNPILHSDSNDTARRYRVEPYVVAADVYSAPQHIGRGGWTWYTGSSGWMYRLGVEAILGVYREGQSLRIKPSIPKRWSGYSITYRYGRAAYHIHVENPQGVSQGVKQVIVDGETRPDLLIPLSDQPGQHEVIVHMG